MCAPPARHCQSHTCCGRTVRQIKWALPNDEILADLESIQEPFVPWAPSSSEVRVLQDAVSVFGQLFYVGTAETARPNAEGAEPQATSWSAPWPTVRPSPRKSSTYRPFRCVRAACPLLCLISYRPGSARLDSGSRSVSSARTGSRSLSGSTTCAAAAGASTPCHDSPQRLEIYR
jgi:hypothetical protein